MMSDAPQGSDSQNRDEIIPFIVRYPELMRDLPRDPFRVCFGCGFPVLVHAETGLSVHIDGTSNLACWEATMTEFIRKTVEG